MNHSSKYYYFGEWFLYCGEECAAMSKDRKITAKRKMQFKEALDKDRLIAYKNMLQECGKSQKFLR